MNTNNFEFGYSGGGSYYEEPRWSDFTLDDEKRAKAKFSRFFLAVSIYLIIANVIVLLSGVIINLTMKDAAEKILGSIWYTWISQIVAMYLVAFPILFFIIKGMRNTVRVKQGMSFKEFFKLLCISEALMMAGNLIGNIINSVISAFIPGDVPNTTEDLIMNSDIWIIILVAVIIGPIVEELIFRKFLMDKLGVYGDRIAIVISALAFGIFHGNLYQLFYSVFLGFMLAYIYSRTSNIIYPIIMHMIINFLGSVVPMPVIKNMDRYTELTEMFMEAANSEEAIASFYAEYGDEFARLSAIVGGYSILIYGLVIAGFILLFKNRRNFFVSDRCEVLIPKEKRTSVILGNVGVIAFLALSVVMIILNLIPTGT